MALTGVFYSLMVLAFLAFFVSRFLTLKTVKGDIRRLHSRPVYYGLNSLFLTVFPAVILLIFWSFAQSILIDEKVKQQIPENFITEDAPLNLIMSEVNRLSEGLKQLVDQGTVSAAKVKNEGSELFGIEDKLESAGVFLSSSISPEVLSASRSKFAMEAFGNSTRNWLAILVSVLGFLWSLKNSTAEFRARNHVERITLFLLGTAATLAIFTSLGIVLSMIFEALRFFGMHPWTDFFFGSTWAPSFSAGSELSILPLLWGTLYISFVALLVSVPIGLYSAIYLSEYASKPIRAIAKPLLEILAGIPTIVYGLFALTTFGPLLRYFFGDGGFLGVEWMSDSRSVITAGVVMGMMLIPFVSSLSDDIINAVPQSLRDGSYGLGATQSETVRKVILPAALPGIIGAILLAASRAIGETMIVVLGAGAVAKFAGNPLEALTTITTRIVSQLTGDLEFDSPETLVAFALGLTLFTITLGLNVLALYIVRKYREQYE